MKHKAIAPPKLCPVSWAKVIQVRKLWKTTAVFLGRVFCVGGGNIEYHGNLTTLIFGGYNSKSGMEMHDICII